MPFTILLLPQTKQDLQEAYEWYSLQQLDLGERFLEHVEEKLVRLSITPGIGSIRYDDVRCTMVDKFPYLIYYNVNYYNNSITVLRILCTYKKPLWE
jgi:plasmid stabilization system protein ParE